MDFPEELKKFMEEIGLYERIKDLNINDFKEEKENPNCEQCQGLENCTTKGYLLVYEEINDKTYHYYTKCPKLKMLEEQLRYSRNIKSSGLPKLYLNKTFENFDVGKNEKAIKRIKEYLQNKEWRKGKGLYITGTVGCGKTHIASAIVHELAKENVYTLFVFVPDFLDEVRSTYDEEQEEEDREDPLELARNSSVLVLDDLGTEKVTEWAKEKLLQLINYRINNNLATIITTNLTMKELYERLGVRIYSRIKGMCEEITIWGEDRRIKKEVV
jgi:DNA replication protein DnaC